VPDTFPRDYWYIAAFASDIGRRLTARTLLSEPVVLYRRVDGKVVALEDRCPHRRISLSLGRLIEDRVQCGYHGLEFDDRGVCVRIPGQDTIPPRACIRAFSTVERDGFVWIWLGNPAAADPANVPSYPRCQNPRLAGKPMEVYVKSNALFLIENVLDLSHIAFVHLRTVGSSYVANFTPQTQVSEQLVEVTRVMNNVENPPLYKQALHFDFGDRVQRIRFWPGGNIQLHITITPAGVKDPAQVRNLHVMSPVTPETERSHFQFIGMYRDFDIGNEALTEFIGEQFLNTVLEDKAIIEDQQRNAELDSPDAELISTAADRGPLAARRMLRRLAGLAEGGSEARANSRP
jgi:phenylpropionate dioxygenase-like ring-hydroxylating dioxygenase large terminal subunit